MKHRFSKGLCLCSFAFVPLLTHAAAPVIEVTPWSAPNGYGSPSFPGAVANEIYALEHGLPAYGDPSSPTYFQTAPANLSISDNMVTGYASWKGDANPGTTFGPAFAGEYGNRLHFGLLVLGNGNQISISQLGFTMDSNDPDNSLDWTYATGVYQYSQDYQGWKFGDDGLPNTADDVFITAGSNTQMVDAIVGRGSGNAWDNYLTDPGATPQDKLNNAIAGVYQGPFQFTGTYTLQWGNSQQVATGSGSVTFNAESPVPEAGPMAASALLVAAMAARKFRTRRA